MDATPLPLQKSKDFKLLIFGETVSTIGDQFTLIAVTWLIVKVWHDPFVLGTILALAAVPRALLMLIGGAVTDRFSSRLVMLISNLARLVIVSVMAGIILFGTVHLWMVYVLMFLFGIADAFFFPAQTAIVPHIAGKEQLSLANTAVQGVAMLSQFVGPMLAGAFIASFEWNSTVLTGIGAALVFDALTFVVSIGTLYFISLRKAFHDEEESLITSVKNGIAYVWKIKSLRYILFAVAAMNLLLVGPFVVGIPVIANDVLPNGVQAYGIIMAAYGIGVLIGYILASSLPKPKPEAQGSFLMLTSLSMGVFLFLLAYAKTTVQFALLSLLLSMASGYVSLSFLTIIQKSIEEKMMGRVMSIIMFSSMGLIPISQAVSGALLKEGTQIIFLGAGVLFTLVVLGVWIVPEVRRVGVVFAE